MRIVRVIRLAMVFVVLLGLTVSALGQQGAQATPELLAGKWRGEQRIQYQQAIRTFKVELEVAAVPASTGRFTHESGRSWQTPIEVRGDTVIMFFDGEKREFVLKRGSDGEPVLETTYSKFRPLQTSNTVELRKEKP